MRRAAIPAMAMILAMAAGCRSARVESHTGSAAAIEIDSAAVALVAAEMERHTLRDLTTRTIRVLHSAGGDTVVTLTVATDRSRICEQRRDTATHAVSLTAAAATNADTSRRQTPAPAIRWTYIALGAAAAIAAAIALRRRR